MGSNITNVTVLMVGWINWGIEPNEGEGGRWKERDTVQGYVGNIYSGKHSLIVFKQWIL